MIKVFIAEDQLLFAQGVKLALSIYKNIEIEGMEQDGNKVIKALENTKPDVLILDINMPGLDGISIAKDLRNSMPELKIVVLSSYASKEFIHQMKTLGVKGYLHKNTDIEELNLAINEVFLGNEYFSKEILDVLNSYTKDNDSNSITNLLTSKELKILSLLAQGLTIPKIAEQMFISTYTAETHKKNILNKLGMKNMALLIKYATERGLV